MPSFKLIIYAKNKYFLQAHKKYFYSTSALQAMKLRSGWIDLIIIFIIFIPVQYFTDALHNFFIYVMDDCIIFYVSNGISIFSVARIYIKEQQ